MRKKFSMGFMMVVLAVMVMSCATIYGEKASEEDRTMQMVQEYPGMEQDQLFILVNTWFVNAFNSAESVIEYSDKEAGKVMGKYTFNYWDTLNEYRVRSTISVEVRDGKVRLTMSDPMVTLLSSAWTGTVSNYGYQPLNTVGGVEKARMEWGLLASGLDETLSKGSPDW